MAITPKTLHVIRGYSNFGHQPSQSIRRRKYSSSTGRSNFGIGNEYRLEVSQDTGEITEQIV